MHSAAILSVDASCLTNKNNQLASAIWIREAGAGSSHRDRRSRSTDARSAGHRPERRRRESIFSPRPSSKRKRPLQLVGAFFFLGLGVDWNRFRGSAIREANHDARSAPEGRAAKPRVKSSHPDQFFLIQIKLLANPLPDPCLLREFLCGKIAGIRPLSDYDSCLMSAMSKIGLRIGETHLN